ncbi:MAG: alpha/beta fold hydrolase [Betaproteobacteria bacterium]
MKGGKEDRFCIDGPSGNLELVVAEPLENPVGLAIVAHPHPLYGGTLDNKVVQTLAKSFLSLGYVAVRFNFRGVGKSDGVYDEGKGELDDFYAVQKYASERYALQKLILAGFSFGTYVVSVAAKTISPDKLVLIAPAVGKFAVENVPDNTLVIHGEEDDVVLLTDVYDWARPQHLPVIVFPGAGHFFHGDLIRLQNVVRKQCADLT